MPSEASSVSSVCTIADAFCGWLRGRMIRASPLTSVSRYCPHDHPSSSTVLMRRVTYHVLYTLPLIRRVGLVSSLILDCWDLLFKNYNSMNHKDPYASGCPVGMCQKTMVVHLLFKPRLNKPRRMPGRATGRTASAAHTGRPYLTHCWMQLPKLRACRKTLRPWLAQMNTLFGNA